MTLENFDLVCGIIQYTFEMIHKNDVKAIDKQVQQRGLTATFEEMQELGLIKYRKRQNDYFIPWHQNFYGDNTIDSYRHKLLADGLKDNEEYKKLIEEEIKLTGELSKVKERLLKIEAAYEYEKAGYKSIAEQIAGLRTTEEDEKDEMDLEVENIIGHPLSDNPLYDYAEAGLL